MIPNRAKLIEYGAHAVREDCETSAYRARSPLDRIGMGERLCEARPVTHTRGLQEENLPLDR